MNLRVMAISLPDSSATMLFLALEALGLSAAPMAHHELFTTAPAFNQNIALDTELDETSKAYELLQEVKPNQFLPGFTFYSKAGSSLLKTLQFKKIIIVRDPRDVVVGHVLENYRPGSDAPLSKFYQRLPGDFERVRASILGFVVDKQAFPVIALENIYRRLRYFTSWCNEPSTLVIRYEDLIDEGKPGQNLVQQNTLGRISEWLGLQYSPEQLSEIAKDLTARFRQQPGLIPPGTWRDYFTPELKPFYKKFVGKLLKKLNYETTPDWIPAEVKKPVVAITLPKAGTHLLDKALRELGLHSNMSAPIKLTQSLNAAEPLAQSLLEGVQPGEYLLTHFFYNWNISQLLDRLEFKKILIIRDPHDVVVSYIRYIQATDFREGKHFLDLPDEDVKLLDAIRGVPYLNIRSASESLNDVLKWLAVSDCLLIRFEDLIGARGQGSRESQHRTIQEICEFLEIEISNEEIALVADNVFDTGALTFKEGQIGTWQRYFKPEHHKAFNKLLGDNIEQFGYKKYQLATTDSSVCDYPVLAITVPGSGQYLLDIVLDEIGLGREFIVYPYPLSQPVEASKAVPLHLMSMYPNDYEAAQTYLGSVENNKYALSCMPFSENGAEIVKQKGFKKVVLGRDRRDAAVALSQSLADSGFPVSKYFRALPDDDAQLRAIMDGIAPFQSDTGQAFLLSNSELFQHLDKWSTQPDTLVVQYEDLVGEIGRGSKTRQLAALTRICDYLGVKWTPQSIELMGRNIDSRLSPVIVEGYIGQWEDYLNSEHHEAGKLLKPWKVSWEIIKANFYNSHKLGKS